jgi:hypothetical protein
MRRETLMSLQHFRSCFLLHVTFSAAAAREKV